MTYNKAELIEAVKSNVISAFKANIDNADITFIDIALQLLPDGSHYVWTQSNFDTSEGGHWGSFALDFINEDGDRRQFLSGIDANWIAREIVDEALDSFFNR